MVRRLERSHEPSEVDRRGTTRRTDVELEAEDLAQRLETLDRRNAPRRVSWMSSLIRTARSETWLADRPRTRKARSTSWSICCTWEKILHFRIAIARNNIYIGCINMLSSRFRQQQTAFIHSARVCARSRNRRANGPVHADGHSGRGTTRTRQREEAQRDSVANAELLPGVGPEIGPAMIAIVAATVFLTAALKGVVGLGLSTGSVVVFSLLYGLETALCLLIAPTVATNVWQGASGGHARALLIRFWPALAAIGPGVWAGSHLIDALAPGEAERGLGIALMLYAGLALARRNARYAPRRERTVTLIAGSANGLITGATGVLTIPMIPYMEALKIERDALVQLMAMVFCTSALALALVLTETGRYDEGLRNLSLWSVGPALAGVLAGERVRARMGAERFRGWLLVALAGVGAKLALFG